MTENDTSFLWHDLVRYKSAKANGDKSTEHFLDETYENFGFFGTCLHPRHSGLASRILFDDEDAFIRFEGKYLALLRKEWQEGMSFEEQHCAVTIEENPEFIQILDLSDISTFNLSQKEKDDIKKFISWNWRLIRRLGTTTDPEKSGFIDSVDWELRMFTLSPGNMDFDELSVFAKPEDFQSESALSFSIFEGIKYISGNLREFNLGNFEIPHAYIYSADGSLASRFRIDTTEPPEHLMTLYETDMPFGKYKSQILEWAKKPPLRMIGPDCRTNWDAMRTAWKDSFEVIRAASRN